MVIKKIFDKTQQILTKCADTIYERSLRNRLANDNFSIVCSNCIGGVIYHRLGKQFLSPTVNMWMNQKEFLIFIENIEEAVKQEVEFVESKYDYPVGRVITKGGVVNLYFNHSKSEEDAKKDWDRRKNRINYDNMYVIMYDIGLEKEDILRLQNIKCKNKIVLSSNKYDDIPYVLTIKPTDKFNGKQYLDKDYFGRRTFEKHFDFVKWLNS